MSGVLITYERYDALLKAEDAVLYALSHRWSSCAHEGGCLPDGVHPEPWERWCAHCRCLDAAKRLREVPRG